MRRLRFLTAVAGTAIATAALTATAAASASPPPTPSPSARAGAPASASRIAALRGELRHGTLSKTQGLTRICAAHHLACQAQVVTKAKGNAAPLAFQPPVGYGATELQKAYGLDTAPAGSGTIVVIGAGAYPTLESDLAIYRSTYHLGACTKANGCFRQLNYTGGPAYHPANGLYDQFGEEEIAVETALDVDMASAACPACKIVSMQVPLNDGFFGTTQHIHNAILHFARGVETARRLGASAVSISYGYPTDSFSDSGSIAQMMTQKGMPIVSSSGDSGFLGHEGQWPQSLATVTSAGGTSLYPDSTVSRGYSEVAWNGAGSGCTRDVAPPLDQPKSVYKLCHGKRTASDISAVADPYTGVAVYDSYAPATGLPLGFIVVGGTSVASPFLAGLYARAPRNPSVIGPNTVYTAPASSFHDVVLGTNYGLDSCETENVGNAVCDSGPGWDGPTGRGTPAGLAPFAG